MRATTYRSGEVALSLPVAVDVVTAEVADSAAVHVDVVWSSVVGVGVSWGGESDPDRSWDVPEEVISP